ncbi:MAG TPA: DPP IV N-terminal domain-containing protein [Chthoniobacterales bacterium]|nr:DPP IV N-terminal domain-containing protein [Chthoniobacterales bacterium]
MYFRLIPLLFFLVTATNAWSDQASESDQYLQRLTETNGFSLGRPTHTEPTPDGKAVIFLRAISPQDRTQALYEFNTITRETSVLVTPDELLRGTPERLSVEERARRERTRTTATGITSFKLSRDGSQIVFGLNGKIIVLNRADGRAAQLETGDVPVIDPTPSPDGQHVAYVRNNNLFVYDLHSKQEQAITTDGTDLKSYGSAEFVAQEEMGRTSGYWWLPDSRSIVYQINDNSRVEVWNVADPAYPEKPPTPRRYPRPGKPNVAVRLAVCSIDQPEPHSIEWDHDKYPYLVRVTPTEDGPLTITVQTREQHDLALLLVDPSTGQTRTMVEEHDPAWLNIDQQMPFWLPGGKFLWTSERQGAWELQLHRTDGQLEKVLLPPGSHYQRFGGVTANEIFYLAGEDPSKHELWHAALDGTGAKMIADGVHSVEFGDHQESIYIDRVETPKSLAKSFVRRIDGSPLGELPSIAEEPPYYPRLEFTIVNDNPVFHAAIVRPRDFDPNKKYPVIIDVYGGPGYNKVIQAARSYLVDQWLADQGFVVVSLDGRGTPGRGRDWERAIYLKLGEIPLADQVTGLRALGMVYPELDLDRVGITGWSFGGYMSALAVVRQPGVFKAAVAGAPVTDWLDYDTHYTERYLGLPGQEIYAAASLLESASRLERPLLFIHGTADDNVFLRHTLKLIDQLERAGRSFEFLPLRGSTHMVLDPILRQQVAKRTAKFFREHL